jgi:adenylosuccinate synthase
MNLVVIGAQWGDEGKGRIVDYMASSADVVVRFSGGANAGHTLVLEGQKYAVHLVPSGILYKDTTVLLGSGMVIDPESLFDELNGLAEQGIDWKGRVLISSRAHLVFPEYKERDRRLDKERKRPIGTTGRGIGIAYSQKANRDGIRLVDIFDASWTGVLSAEENRFLDLYRDQLKDMMVDITAYIHEKQPKRMLMEGAQGALLDLDLGTYPYVSSGYSAAAGASLGAGIGPRDIDGVLGVFKAYSTRVGNGPFPSEFLQERDGDLGERVQTIGKEFGVTTGRKRRCGYLDLVALKYACIANGIDGLILTKLDIYDSFDEVTACVAYRIDGVERTDFPASIDELYATEPVLKTFRGWKTDLTGITEYDQLPAEAREYIAFIEDYTGTSVTVVSVGPERNQIIIRRELWTEY